MSQSGVVRALLGLLNSAADAACGCGARAWSMAVERNLIGVTVRAEARSR